MDEMGVWIDYHKQLYWIKPGEPRPIKESDSEKARLNVWGAIWYNGKSTLHVTRDNFNTTKYVEVLEAELPLGRHRFIQDGVPFHWTLAVSNWFADHRVRLIEDFPAKSPDLNAILNMSGVGWNAVLRRTNHMIMTLWKQQSFLHGRT